MTSPISRITNSEALTRIFGTWPAFHDAEVLQISLDRDGPAGPELESQIHVFEMTAEVTQEGFYELRNHTLATLAFSGVDELRIEDFNQQNVLYGLTLTDISNRQLDVLKWEVSFSSSFGVSAQFLCKTIGVVSAEPFTPGTRRSAPHGTRSGPRPLG
jgi:hypothetical protein